MDLDAIIARAIGSFTAEQGINFSKEIINDFVYRMKIRRRLSLPVDIYLYLCKFLDCCDIVILTTLCKDYMKQYYSSIWGDIQSRYFEHSIIPPNEYLSIRNNIAIDKWWQILSNNEMIEWICDIKNDEKIIQDRRAELDMITPRSINYIWKKYTHLAEINANINYINNINASISVYEKQIIDNFRFISKTDNMGNKYLSIKQPLDSRLYGLDPQNNDDIEKWNITFKWITGEYNDEREYYTDIDNHDGDDNEFQYEYDSDDEPYRIRIRPEWI